MSIQNFPKISKITLKKSYDEVKVVKNQESNKIFLFPTISMIMVHFYVELPLTLCRRRINAS